MILEGREQPGSMFSTGLDGAILAGEFGEEILKASRPALVNTQVPRKIDSTEITLLPASRPLSVQAHGTIIQQTETQSIQAIDGLSDRRVFAIARRIRPVESGRRTTSRRFRRHARRRSAQLQRRLRWSQWFGERVQYHCERRSDL